MAMMMLCALAAVSQRAEFRSSWIRFPVLKSTLIPTLRNSGGRRGWCALHTIPNKQLRLRWCMECNLRCCWSVVQRTRCRNKCWHWWMSRRSVKLKVVRGYWHARYWSTSSGIRWVEYSCLRDAPADHSPLPNPLPEGEGIFHVAHTLIVVDSVAGTTPSSR